VSDVRSELRLDPSAAGQENATTVFGYAKVLHERGHHPPWYLLYRSSFDDWLRETGVPAD